MYCTAARAVAMIPSAEAHLSRCCGLAIRMEAVIRITMRPWARQRIATRMAFLQVGWATMGMSESAAFRGKKMRNRSSLWEFVRCC